MGDGDCAWHLVEPGPRPLQALHSAVWIVATNTQTAMTIQKLRPFSAED